MAILEVQHIEKHFGDTQVLSDISFSLEEGQALSIIGSSGSGKTTLLRCLNFLERPDHGSIAVKGGVIFDAEDPSTQAEKDIRQKRLHFGLVFQNFNLFPQYTALQNVTLARELLAKEKKEIERILERHRNARAMGRPAENENLEFHYKLAEIADNSVIFNLLKLILTQNSAYIQFSFMDYTLVGSTLFHAQIFEAIKAHDPDRASKLMYDHINALITTLTNIEHSSLFS